MLTVVILTKNEENNIVGAIKNAQLVAKDVLIVDSGSTDNTVKLAEDNGARVVYRAWDNDFAAQRNFALKYVKTKWVLYLDADERLNDRLIESIKKAVLINKNYMYELTRRNSAFRKDFKYGVLGPDSVLRMFPIEGVKWVGKVHEKPVSKYQHKYLQGYLKHYTYKSFEEYLKKMNQYSTISAMDKRNAGKKVCIVKDIIFRPVFAFIKMYVLKLGFLEGWQGFVLAINYANYTLSKYVKLKLMEEK